jgi:hypothetical protein
MLVRQRLCLLGSACARGPLLAPDAVLLDCRMGAATDSAIGHTGAVQGGSSMFYTQRESGLNPDSPAAAALSGAACSRDSTPSLRLALRTTAADLIGRAWYPVAVRETA